MTTTQPRPNQLELFFAAQDLAETFSDSWTARQVGQAMTCNEAETLAAVIRLVDPMAAGAFLRGHANGETAGDSPEDMHYHLRDDVHADQPHFFGGEDDRCTVCGKIDSAEDDNHIDPTGDGLDGTADPESFATSAYKLI